MIYFYFVDIKRLKKKKLEEIFTKNIYIFEMIVTFYILYPIKTYLYIPTHRVGQRLVYILYIYKSRNLM